VIYKGNHGHDAVVVTVTGVIVDPATTFTVIGEGAVVGVIAVPAMREKVRVDGIGPADGDKLNAAAFTPAVTIFAVNAPLPARETLAI
jgi:hypothetical protein